MAAYRLAAAVTLLGVVSACGAPVEAPAAWADRVAATHDARSALEMLAARDTTGMATAITSWQEALKGRTTEEVTALDLFTFVARYQPIWTQDKLNTEALSKLTARAKALNPEFIGRWKTALEKAQGDGVSELWTAALVVAVDDVFNDAGIDGEASAAFRARLERIPADATQRLADVMKQGKAVAAILIAETDAMFARDLFQATYFNEAIDELQKRLTP